MADFESTPRPLDIVLAVEDTEFRYEPDGEPERLELPPPMPNSEIERLAARIPCPLPDSVRELLKLGDLAFQRPCRGQRFKDWLGWGQRRMRRHHE